MEVSTTLSYVIKS